MTSDGRFSVAFPKRWWYPACPSADLGRRPVPITLMDASVVLFRDGSGRPSALIDRCPHRNLALSLGQVHADGNIECAYHGWRFDGGGRCMAVPGLLAGEEAAATPRNVDSYATCEQDGFVWVWGEAGAEPAGRPFALPPLEGRGAGQAVFFYDLDCTMHASLENALDVPHTAFLHKGIFRGAGEKHAVTAVREELPGGLQVEYLGEPVGMGPIRFKDRSNVTFDHWDRFFLPSIAQIEYRVQGWLRIVNTILHLPLSPFRTRASFVVRFWTPAPAAVVGPIVLARGRKILRQDASILASQTAQIRRFGGERYTSTDLDLMGNGIWRLLRQAERAERIEAGGTEAGGADEVTDADSDGLSRRSVTFQA